MPRKSVTLADVAREAGVSVTTASAVLNDKAKHLRISDGCADRVRKAARTVGYAGNYHATCMRLGRSNTIGMAINVAGLQQGLPGIPLTDNDYYLGLMAGVQIAAHEVGLDLTMIAPGRDLKAAENGLDALAERRIDALILPHGHKYGHLLDGTIDRPVVVIDPGDECPMPAVTFDQQAAVERIMDHLAELRHRRLLWVGAEGNAQRETMFRRACEARQIQMESCLFDFPGPGPSDDREKYRPFLQFEQAEQAVDRYLANHPTDFTAVVCYNDLVAHGAMRAMSRRGIAVGEEVSVVGWDNINSARTCWPGLTTVDHRFAEMGHAAGKLALRMISGDSKIRQTLAGHREVVEPRLVVRESTAPAK